MGSSLHQSVSHNQPTRSIMVSLRRPTISSHSVSSDSIHRLQLSILQQFLETYKSRSLEKVKYKFFQDILVLENSLLLVQQIQLHPYLMLVLVYSLPSLVLQKQLHSFRELEETSTLKVKQQKYLYLHLILVLVLCLPSRVLQMHTLQDQNPMDYSSSMAVLQSARLLFKLVLAHSLDTLAMQMSMQYLLMKELSIVTTTLPELVWRVKTMDSLVNSLQILNLMQQLQIMQMYQSVHMQMR